MSSRFSVLGCAVCVVICTSVVSVASGDAIQELTVNAASRTPTQTEPIPAGVEYYIEVTGIVHWDDEEDRYCDAEFLMANHGTTWIQNRDDLDDLDDAYDLDVMATSTRDEMGQDWLAQDAAGNWVPDLRSTTQTYRLFEADLNGDGNTSFLVGDGNPIFFLFLDNRTDSAYGDNSGAFNVAIYEVPEPATLSLLAIGGLAMIHRRKV